MSDRDPKLLGFAKTEAHTECAVRKIIAVHHALATAAMLLQRPLLFCSLLLIIASVACFQPRHAPSNPPSPASIPVSISEDSLGSRGFSFDDRELPMCKISGPEGTCRVEAFVFWEKTTDEAAFTCRKLDRASYLGRCVDGKLDGVSVVIADGSAKQAREAFISYFHEGRIAYPVLTSYLTGDLNFGVQEKSEGYGCVYFGEWDESAKRCGRFTEIYGPDIFTESNAQKLRDGTFDLSHYRAKFLEFARQK